MSETTAMSPVQATIGENKPSGLIAWFACNPVVANLLMLLIISAGLVSALTISKDMFPLTEMHKLQINAPYPGAAPIEVEKGVILPIESALQGLKGIKKIQSTARRDAASIELEIENDEDLNEVMAQVKNRMDSIVNFPQHLETPTIIQVEPEKWVIGVAVSGDIDARNRKVLGQQMRDELLALPEVKKVKLWGVKDYEIAIEVSEQRLRELNLTLDEVARTLRLSSLDLPAGMIKTQGGNLLLRTEGKAQRGEDYAGVVLRSHADGTQLLLSDVATITDGFVESDAMMRFDRGASLGLGIFSVGNQDLLSIDKAVKRYIEQKQKTLPDGLHISPYFATSFYLKGRLDMMLNSLAFGAVLVCLVLGLFLNLQVAAWVMVGIPVSFLGAFWLMPVNPYPVNITIPSLFAFIMVLGIVVDDAIVIGESIYSEAKNVARKNGENAAVCSRDTVIRGAQKVAVPATIGVLTTIAAFAPMLFVGGKVAAVFESIAVVVILCLLFSLIESKWILPAHLVGLRLGHSDRARFTFITRLQRATDRGLTRFVNGIYLPLLNRCLRNRYTTLAVFLAFLMIAVTAVRSGIVHFEFFPNVPSDGVRAKIVMHDGASPKQLRDTLLAVEAAAYQVDQDYRQAHPEAPPLIDHVMLYTENDTTASAMVPLSKSEDRQMTSVEFEQRWRQAAGPLVGVREQRYYATTSAGGGANINLSLSGSDPHQLGLAAKALQDKLSEYEGVYDIHNSQGVGSQEVKIHLKPYAHQLGINLADVARQVRQAFYGEEVQRLQRGSDTLKVMVRYPLAERRSLASLEKMQIRTRSGNAVAIDEVADIQLGQGITAITRIDRRRTVTITANTDAEKVQTGKVIQELTGAFIPQLLGQYPTVSFGLSGASLDQQKLMQRIALCFAASLFFIYALLAIPLRSYVQPLVIMAIIPFGFIGAVIGHVIFGVAISMMSLFGLVALAGVVINDSLILVEFANRERQQGSALESALLTAGKHRFRAIVLTTLTTFVGLLPILFETSLQAKFVIPMALSLGFGIVFATAITLILIPCLYSAVEDVLNWKPLRRFAFPKYSSQT